MSLKIIQINRNPRPRVSTKKRALNRKRSRIIRTEIRAGYGPKQAAAIAYAETRKRKRRVKIIRAKKNPHGKAYYDGFNAYNKGYPLNSTGIGKFDKNSSNPEWREGWLAAKQMKKLSLVRNPAKRKEHRTIIVGYSIRGKFYTRGGRRKTQRWYYTGDHFSPKEKDAKIFPGDAAKHEAYRILPRLPYPLYEIRVEKI